MYKRRFWVYPVSAAEWNSWECQYICNITKNPFIFCAYRWISIFFKKIWDSAIYTKNKWVFSDIVYILTFSRVSFGSWYGINPETPIIHLYTDYTLIMYKYTYIQRVFSDLYNDKNVQTVHKARTSPTRRGNDQTTIYIPGGFIRACRAFWRLMHIKIKYHILLL